MKRRSLFLLNAVRRDALLVAALSVCVLSASSGCAVFGKKSPQNSQVAEFDESEETEKSTETKDKDASVFDAEREKQSGLSDFVSQFGRKSKTKKEVDPGQTFLMSDKAKEIYANTER
ncbi:MAG: hypothetical protein IKU86_00235 [Thermoguttaceae bacterium]|nr:hypothetical protein [Thermoguttaceae bacterium]